MAFAVKDWKNRSEGLLTALSADALEDAEARLSGYTDTRADEVLAAAIAAAGSATPADGSVTLAKLNSGLVIPRSMLGALGLTDADVASGAGIQESKLSLASDAAAGIPSRRTLGPNPTQAAPGNDARFSDARVPTDGSATWEKLGDYSRMGGAAGGWGTLPGVFAQNMHWSVTNGAASAMVSGTMRLFGGLTLPKGRTVNSFTFLSSGTSASGLTHLWAALYDRATRALIGVTADDTGGWAGASWKTLSLTAPYTPAANQEVYVGVVTVFSTTPPTIVGCAVPTRTTAPLMTANSNTGLTDPASAPATATLGAGVGGCAWVQVA